jgi:hypothetical protein
VDAGRLGESRSKELHPLEQCEPEQYEPLIGAATVERIARKAEHARFGLLPTYS